VTGTGVVDGPRALRDGEWGELDAVVGTVFRPEMFHDYPQLFDRDNREHLRVVAADGKVVCHVGFTERPATLAGCRVDVACIGAVATLEAYRGRGYASLAFQDACDVAASDGIDVMLISGGRGLYTRVGCRAVGQDWNFSLTPDEAPRLQAVPAVAGAGAYALAPVGPERIDVLRALYQREPVRFLRPLRDWEMAFDCGVVMNTASDFWAVSDGETILAYLIVHQPDKVRRRPEDPLPLRVVELAGERALVAAALPRLLAHYGAERLTVHVQGSDPALKALLTAGGLEGTPAAASGTLRVINFRQLMERCRPYLAERVGAGVAEALDFEAGAPPGGAGGGFTIRRGAEAVRLPDLATLAVYLFGTPEAPGAARETPEGSPDLVATLAMALPLPALWYGINYV
jgi:predicted N-acetyltransferase YhbS